LRLNELTSHEDTWKSVTTVRNPADQND